MTTNLLVEYGITETALTELSSKYGILPDVTTKDGYNGIKQGIAEIRGLRGDVETKRKELKADSLAWGRKVDGEAKRIVAALLNIENPMRLLKDERDAEIQAKLDAQAKAEEDRIKTLKDRINNISRLADDCIASDAAKIQKTLAHFETIPIDETFMEFQEDAATVHADARARILVMLEKAIEYEAVEAQRLKEAEALRAEREAFAAEQKAAEAKLKAEREAITKELEIKEQARKEREAAEQKERDIKNAALKAKLEAEQKERDIENARIEATQKVEQDKLDAQRADIEREQAAISAAKLKAEQDAQEAAEAKKQQQANKAREKKRDEATIVALTTAAKDQEVALVVFAAIKAGKIPHVELVL